MKRARTQSGYIGLILLLIGVAATVYSFQKMYFSPTKSTSASNTNTQPVPQYGSLLGDISAAKAVVNQTEAKEAQTNKVLNSLK